MIKEYYNSMSTYLMEIFNSDYLFLIILLTTSVSIVYFIVITYIITQMDTRYFIRKKISPNNTNQNNQLPHKHHTINRTIAHLIKIVEIIIGLILIVCGLAMLVLPGQGIITLIIGLSLVPFPGKDKLERNLLARASVQSTLNWIRVKANKKPFVFNSPTLEKDP